MVDEEAFWPGFAVTLAQPLSDATHCLALDTRAAGGVRGVYDGYTQIGLPFETDVTHINLDSTLSLRGELVPRLDWEVGATLERFDRRIEPKGTTGGIAETYTWYWLGAGATWRLCPDCALPLAVRLSWQTLVDGASDVNLYKFGDARIDFDGGDRYGLALALRPPAAGSPGISLAWTRRDIEGTGLFPVIGNSFSVRQPPFYVEDFALRIDWMLR